MSTFVVPIGIKLEEISAVFGSKNNELFVKLISSDVYNYYDEEYSFKRELEEIIFNYVTVKNRIIKPSKLFGLIKGDDGRGLNGEWFDYAFALLIICHHLGLPFMALNEELKIDIDWEQFQLLLSSTSPSYDLNKFLISEQLFDTPFKKEEEIKTCLLNKAELHQLKMALNSLSPEISTRNLKNLFNTMVNTCLEKEMNLIFFSIEKIDD
jgi:hypothetical protein